MSRPILREREDLLVVHFFTLAVAGPSKRNGRPSVTIRPISAILGKQRSSKVSPEQQKMEGRVLEGKGWARSVEQVRGSVQPWLDVPVNPPLC